MWWTMHQWGTDDTQLQFVQTVMDKNPCEVQALSDVYVGLMRGKT